MIDLTEQETIAYVNLNWSDASILTEEMLSELTKLIDYLEDESQCTLVIFKGLNTEKVSVNPNPPNIDICRKWENFLLRVERFLGASMACIDGFCTCFHLQLALVCDYRVATTNSIFQIPEVKEGYLPGMSIFRLAKYTGIGIARRLLFTGIQWSIQEAVMFGIIDRQCEPEDLTRTIQEAQESLMPIHPEVLRNTRRLLNESFATHYEEAIGHFLAVQNLVLLPKQKLDET